MSLPLKGLDLPPIEFRQSRQDRHLQRRANKKARALAKGGSHLSTGPIPKKVYVRAISPTFQSVLQALPKVKKHGQHRRALRRIAKQKQRQGVRYVSVHTARRQAALRGLVRAA